MEHVALMLAGPRRRPATAGEPFERLFVREYPRVLAIARRLLLDEHAAEDVAQDVFVSFHRLHDPSAPFASAWLHRAAAHSALNVIRSNRRRANREQSSAARDVALTRPESLVADPEHAALADEERRAVRAALRRLPERSRAVLALRHSGLSYAETAAALRVKINQVGTLLARAEAAFIKEISRASSR
jgi:RNA polymerase sigma factor (sigma-70 family)